MFVFFLVVLLVLCDIIVYNTVELQWLEHLWKHENIFETGVVRGNECKSVRQVKRHNKDF